MDTKQIEFYLDTLNREVGLFARFFHVPKKRARELILTQQESCVQFLENLDMPDNQQKITNWWFVNIYNLKRLGLEIYESFSDDLTRLHRPLYAEIAFLVWLADILSVECFLRQLCSKTEKGLKKRINYWLDNLFAPKKMTESPQDISLPKDQVWFEADVDLL